MAGYPVIIAEMCLFGKIYYQHIRFFLMFTYNMSLFKHLKMRLSPQQIMINLCKSATSYDVADCIVY